MAGQDIVRVFLTIPVTRLDVRLIDGVTGVCVCVCEGVDYVKGCHSKCLQSE